jgi:VanZ family protein
MPERLLVAFRFLLAVTVVAITVLSLSPSAPSAPGGNDKLAHLLAYAVIAFLLVLSARRSPNRFLHVLTVLGVTIVYGIVIEVVQQFTGREFDVADMAANSLGAVVGTVAGLATRRLIGDRSGAAER